MEKARRPPAQRLREVAFALAGPRDDAGCRFLIVLRFGGTSPRQRARRESSIPTSMLSREEYIEQTYLFRTLRERMQQNMSTQELLAAVKQELLATTKLPLAVEFLRDELKLVGAIAPAMARVPHYFSPFQTFVAAEAERDDGHFDFRVALEVLEREAEYRANGAPLQGLFFYQFESICRNRLGYDRGLAAIAGDDVYSDDWREWLRNLRRQVGFIDLCDMIYVRSEFYRQTRGDSEKAVLFGEKEGRIAMANRRKDPLLLFAALQRHLGYPGIPRPRPEDANRQLLPNLQRRVERLESRIKLLEEELRGGINLARFYGEKTKPAGDAGG